jgi:uncharacterized membrane protein YeaQ/YmgE (transglycosylase-associated protein family)
MVFLSIIGWIVVGLIVGYIASRLVDLRGDDVRFGMTCAVAGAVVAGILQAIFSGHGMSPWQMWGAVFAMLGAAVGAGAWHLIRSRSISHEQGSFRQH